MTSLQCPGCRFSINRLPADYSGTIQCGYCAKIVYVVFRGTMPIDAHLRGFNLDLPPGLPPNLDSILAQALACFGVGSNAATVVMVGLFIEGLLKEVGLSGERLVDMIERAHKEKIVSPLGYGTFDLEKPPI
jgi:hypothetical protein